MRQPKAVFKTDEMSTLKRKIEAFTALYDEKPTIKVLGPIHSKGYGIFHTYSEMEIWDVRRKYFTATVDGKKDEGLSPTWDKMDGEATTFFLY
jgi:hypothetical protein